MSTNISDERASYQAVFALDIITAAGALILLGTASKPTFQRIIARRFTSTSKSHGTPLKTSLGTYLFLWPALFCLFAAYTTRFVSDLLQTHGFIAYEADLSWNGRPSFSIPENKWGTGVSALTFATTFATILFTVLLNGGVWIHATHIQSNGTGRVAPNMLSKIWNTFILLAMLATGMAAWGVGMSERDTSLGSLSSLSRLSWSNVLNHDPTTRILYIVHECIVVVASMSVTFEVLREYSTTNKNAHGSSESQHLARFAFVVVPLIWLRDIFIIYDIILLYVDTSGWSDNASLATTFILIIFGQFANLTILAMILWGAWRMGRTVKLFDSNSSA
ncbi:hypothetical protein HBI81_046200 [Parastagonospora nodorum]|nr:hypothetical protein HBI44_014460 [Parastagonospora nodorum]KAH6540106.1 hypothetical protein HBI81_046200 [Parastagonospora nodorum]